MVSSTKSKTLNSKVYTEMLIGVNAGIKKKCRTESRGKKVMFHQDNARPYVSAFTGWTLYRLKWDLLQHLSYRLQITPLDFYLLL
ncbi:hypothetical protein X975_00415, partial [Stegodyphus mimosarum]